MSFGFRMECMHFGVSGFRRVSIISFAKGLLWGCLESSLSGPDAKDTHIQGFMRVEDAYEWMDKILHDLIYLNYGIYGTILSLGHAEFCPSAV